MQLDKDKILRAIQEEATQEEIDYLVSLDEMATVGRSQKEKLLIQINPAESFTGDFYFKAFDSANEQHAKHMARIKFERPVYIVHARRYNRGKDYWWLSARDKRKLIDYLEAQNTNNPQYTNWQYAILAYNNEKGLDFDKTQENLLADGQLKYPNFIPYDLTRPNYELLASGSNAEKLNERILLQIAGKSLAESERIIKKILESRHG